MAAQLAPDVRPHDDSHGRNGADLLRVLAALGVLAGLAALDGAADRPAGAPGQSPTSVAVSGTAGEPG